MGLGNIFMVINSSRKSNDTTYHKTLMRNSPLLNLKKRKSKLSGKADAKSDMI